MLTPGPGPGPPLGGLGGGPPQRVKDDSAESLASAGKHVVISSGGTADSLSSFSPWAAQAQTPVDSSGGSTASGDSRTAYAQQQLGAGPGLLMAGPASRVVQGGSGGRSSGGRGSGGSSGGASPTDFYLRQQQQPGLQGPDTPARPPSPAAPGSGSFDSIPSGPPSSNGLGSGRPSLDGGAAPAMGHPAAASGTYLASYLAAGQGALPQLPLQPGSPPASMGSPTVAAGGVVGVPAAVAPQMPQQQQQPAQQQQLFTLQAVQATTRAPDGSYIAGPATLVAVPSATGAGAQVSYPLAQQPSQLPLVGLDSSQLAALGLQQQRPQQQQQQVGGFVSPLASGHALAAGGGAGLPGAGFSVGSPASPAAAQGVLGGLGSPTASSHTPSSLGANTASSTHSLAPSRGGGLGSGMGSVLPPSVTSLGLVFHSHPVLPEAQLSPGPSAALSTLSQMSAQSAPAALSLAQQPGGAGGGPSAAHAAESAHIATAVAAQQSAAAEQAAATYNAAAAEAQAAKQAVTMLTATAQQAVAEQRPDVAHEAVQQAVQAQQRAAVVEAVANEAAALYADATAKAATAQQQISAARAEAVAAATQAVQAAATTLATGSGGAVLPPPATLPPPHAVLPAVPAPAMAAPAMAAPALAQQGSAGAATGTGQGSSPEVPSRSSTLVSDSSQHSLLPQHLSIEQAQQQLALLQQYLAQQAQQAQQGAAVGVLSPPGLSPQPSALSYVSSLDGSASNLAQLMNAAAAVAGMVPPTPTQPIPAQVPAGAPGGLSGMPASAPLAAQIAGGVLVPAGASGAQLPAMAPPSASALDASSAVGASHASLQQAHQAMHPHPYAQHSPSPLSVSGLPNLLHYPTPRLQMVKVVCSSGGAFIKLSTGSWEYEGGETRLVGIPLGCDYAGLLEALERITAPVSESSGATPGYAPMVKYRLPSDPSVWVDVVDTEDVQLMFDEWMEFCGGQRTNTKMHVFVQWSGGQESLTEESHGAASHPEEEQEAGKGEEAENGPRRHNRGHDEASWDEESPSESEESDHEQRGKHEHRKRQGKRGEQVARLRPSLDLAAIVEKMEIIDAADVSLVRFLGSGGYGDVWLAKWHNCEVAVKCLNPSLFFNGGNLSSVNTAAIADLVKEADMLGSLRHPNVVWIYGVVLPNLEDRKGWKKRNRDLAELFAASGPAMPAIPGLLRPPALVAEYMGGGSLKSALLRKADIVAGALTRVVLALDAAKGMEYLASKNIIHFDLKSGNLLLGYRDRRPVCKVADFGLSKQKFETFVSGVTSQRGTLPWTAPEIIRTPDKVTEKVDVFSFGIVMWELWAGREPYEGLNYHALLLQLSNPDTRLRPPIPGSADWDGEAVPELAPGWQALMERCWAESPDDRPSWTEIIKELRGMVSALKPARTGSKTLAGGRVPSQ